MVTKPPPVPRAMYPSGPDRASTLGSYAEEVETTHLADMGPFLTPPFSAHISFFAAVGSNSFSLLIQ